MFIKVWITYTIKKIVIIAYFLGYLRKVINNYPDVIHKLYTICGFNYVNKMVVYNYVDKLYIVFLKMYWTRYRLIKNGIILLKFLCI